MRKAYIVLHKDGTYTAFGTRQHKADFADGATLWVADERATLLDLQDWAGRGFRANATFTVEQWVDA